MHADPIASAGSLVAIIPVRSLEGAKSRLGETLDPEERQALVSDLFERTVRAALYVPAIGSVSVVSPDPAVLEAAVALGAATLLQTGDGLNIGLSQAAARATADGATSILVISADLPAISGATLAAVVEAGARAAPGLGHGLLVIVPDRHGRGTNALLVRPPDLIPFAFGADSRLAHLTAARAVGAVIVEVDSPLGLDVDVPDDLLLAEQLGLVGQSRVS